MIRRNKGGDILATACRTIVVPVNATGQGARGLLARLKKLDKAMYKNYTRASKHRAFNQSIVFTEGDLYRYVLLPVRYHWRSKPSLTMALMGLQALHNFITYNETNAQTVGSLAVQADLGEAEWRDELLPLLEDCLGDLPIPVEIYEAERAIAV